MTDRELRKLSRKDLLEMLLIQSRELTRVKQELEEANAQLQQRRIAISQSGSIAEAALKLNGIFEAAQAAADQYLENMSIPAEYRAMPQTNAGEESEEILQNTREQCRQMLEQTRRECDEMLAKAEETRRHMQYDSIRRELNLNYEGNSYESGE